MELVLEQGFTQRLLHELLACVSLLPVWEPHLINNFIDVVDNPLNNDRRVSSLGAFEELRKRSLALVLVLFRLNCTLSGD